jgi:hypothetical protein
MQRLPEAQRRAAPAQQEVVEFAATNAIAHRLPEVGARLPISDPPHPEAVDRLEHVILGECLGFDPEILEDLRRHPAGAELVAREAPPVEHQHVEAGLAQRPGAGRARGPTPHDDDVTRLHA